MPLRSGRTLRALGLIGLLLLCLCGTALAAAQPRSLRHHRHSLRHHRRHAAATPAAKRTRARVHPKAPVRKPVPVHTTTTTSAAPTRTPVATVTTPVSVPPVATAPHPVTVPSTVTTTPAAPAPVTSAPTLTTPAAAMTSTPTTTTGAPSAPVTADAAMPAKASCVYSAESIAQLNSFATMVGRPADCAQVYANSATTWSQFTYPWFINYVNQPNNNWSAWTTTPNTQRRLVITINFGPSSINSTDWLGDGAAGAYEPYDTQLADTLVAAGLGNAIIRIAPEMNGTWYPYSLGSGAAQWAEWDQLWTNTVTAMRAAPGAHFLFDWCLSSGYRALPLDQIYPGDNVVDIIGFDVYDTGNIGSTPAARWTTLTTQSDGLNQIIAFAHAHGKPLSIPEWGVATTASGGGGDDPTFVNGIAQIVASDPVVYQSYFDNYGNATQLADGPLSLAAYQAAFGANGYAIDSGSDSW